MSDEMQRLYWQAGVRESERLIRIGHSSHTRGWVEGRKGVCVGGNGESHIKADTTL